MFAQEQQQWKTGMPDRRLMFAQKQRQWKNRTQDSQFRGRPLLQPTAFASGTTFPVSCSIPTLHGQIHPSTPLLPLRQLLLQLQPLLLLFVYQHVHPNHVRSGATTMEDQDARTGDSCSLRSNDNGRTGRKTANSEGDPFSNQPHLLPGQHFPCRVRSRHSTDRYIHRPHSYHCDNSCSNCNPCSYSSSIHTYIQTSRTVHR